MKLAKGIGKLNTRVSGIERELRAFNKAVVEAVGIKDILSKSLGSSNPINVVRATVEGLRQLRNPEEERARRRAAAAAGRGARANRG